MKYFFSYFQNLTFKKVILIFTAVGILIYANSLTNPFFGDDNHQIINNSSIHSLSKIPSLFLQGTFSDTSESQRNNYYKPVLSSTYNAIYFFFKDNPIGYHLIQVLIHITNSILVYQILKYFFDQKISFFLSLLFLTHPINTEAVIHAAALQEPLFLIFGLSALFFSIRENGKHYLITILLLMSLLSKEAGVVFLLIIPAFTYLYKKKVFSKSLQQSVVSFSIYIFLRFVVAKIYFPQNPIVPIMTLSFWERVINIPKIIFFYLKTFFYPKDLLVLQSWVIKNLDFKDFFMPAILDLTFFLLLVTIGKIIHKKKLVYFKTFLFFFVWFIVGLGLHLQIIRLDQTVSDRWFYFPIIGLLGVVGTIISYLNLNLGLKSKITTLLVLLIIVVFSSRVIIRNSNWKDRLTLITHDIKVNQDSYQLEGGLAGEYESRGNISEAEKHFTRSVELFPSLNSYSNIGAFYLRNDRFKNAADAFNKAVRYDPHNFPAWFCLAISKYNSGDKQGALEAAARAYQISPNRIVLNLIGDINNNKKLRLK